MVEVRDRRDSQFAGCNGVCSSDLPGCTFREVQVYDGSRALREFRGVIDHRQSMPTERELQGDIVRGPDGRIENCSTLDSEGKCSIPVRVVRILMQRFLNGVVGVPSPSGDSDRFMMSRALDWDLFESILGDKYRELFEQAMELSKGWNLGSDHEGRRQLLDAMVAAAMENRVECPLVKK